MEFELSGALRQCAVEVEHMPDNIESFRSNRNGLLFRLTVSTTINGESLKRSYDIQGWSSGFITTLPSNAEFITKQPDNEDFTDFPDNES